MQNSMFWCNVTCCCQHGNLGSLTLRCITPHLPKILPFFGKRKPWEKSHFTVKTFLLSGQSYSNLWSSPLIPSKKLGKFQELDGARVGCLFYTKE